MRQWWIVAVIVTLLTAFSAGAALGAGPATSKVIIGFNGQPNVEMVKGLGGRVQFVYDVIPAVAAEVPERALGALKAHAGVAYVEPDAVAHVCESYTWNMTKIRANSAHSAGYDGYGVKVCVIDTGVDVDHPDLVYRGGYDYVNYDSNPDDDHGHGTHVAGIATAPHNGIGVIGVAPQAYLYACKVLNASGSGSYSAIVAGIDWARNNGMDVINMSLGGSSGSTSLNNACQNAYNAGVLVVAAAGNTGGSVLYPARYSSVVAVAATDSNDVRPWWSSYGPEVEVSAPGVSIYSTYRGGGYTTMSGTSMASPHVAGEGAIIWDRYPSWSVSQVRYGRIDCWLAVQ